jgi:hypothetical protein
MPVRRTVLRWMTGGSSRRGEGVAMQEMSVLVILLTIYFLGFISGFGTRAIISQGRRHKARKAHYAAQVDGSAHRAVSAQPSEKDSSANAICSSHACAYLERAQHSLNGAGAYAKLATATVTSHANTTPAPPLRYGFGVQVPQLSKTFQTAALKRGGVQKRHLREALWKLDLFSCAHFRRTLIVIRAYSKPS